MKIIYLFPKKLHDTKMSSGRRWYAHAVARQPGVKVSYWGERWPGYDSRISVMRNLELQGHEDADFLWLYKPDGLRGIADCPIPKFVCYNECWPDQPGKARQEVRGCCADLVIHHHWRDRECFLGFQGRIHHIPHGAPAEVFYNTTPHSQRPVACLSSGVQSPEIYPVRDRLAGLVRSGAIPGAVRPHPGYRLRSVEECDRQAAEYASALASARVSLCCTSKYRYGLAKILESALAGCLVVSDVPDEPDLDPLFQHVLCVDSRESDRSISDQLNFRFADRHFMQRHASEAQKIVLENFTTDHYAKKLLACLQDML